MDEHGRCKIIGLTGGTGTGKSSVAHYFERDGIMIIDGDKISREVTRKGEPCLDEIAENFEGVIRPDGELDRRKLSHIVFSDPEKLGLLNRITHKYIIAEMERLIEGCDEPGVIIDAAALIESGLSERCDVIIAVVADKELRARRIMARDEMTFDEARERIGAQKEDSFYTDRADFVIFNNGDADELEMQTGMIIGVIFGQ